MLLTRKGLLWSLSWTFKLLTSNLCVKWLFHMEGYYTSLTATAFSRASNTSLAGNWCLMRWKRSKIARGWDWRKLSSLLLLKCKWSPLFSYSLIASEPRTETWKRGLCLGGQKTDILSYFYHHLLCSVICKPTAERWAFQAGAVFVTMPQSWNPAALALPLVMRWLSVRERGLQPSWPWGTHQECAEYEGLYWHASCPFQTMTKSRCPVVNVRTWQVTLLSFGSSFNFTTFSVEEFFGLTVSTLSDPYCTSLLWLSLWGHSNLLCP